MSHSLMQKSNRALTYAGIFLEHAHGVIVPAPGKSPVSKFEALDGARSDELTTTEDPLCAGRFVSIRTLPQSAAEDAESLLWDLTRDGADKTQVPAVITQLTQVRDKFLDAAEYLTKTSAGRFHGVIEGNIEIGLGRLNQSLQALQRL